MADWADYLMGLSTLLSQKKITSITDNGEASDKGPFKGIDSIVDGVEVSIWPNNTLKYKRK